MNSEIRDIVELQLAYLRDMLQLKEISLTLKDMIDWAGRRRLRPAIWRKAAQVYHTKRGGEQNLQNDIGWRSAEGQTITLDAKAGELIFDIS